MLILFHNPVKLIPLRSIALHCLAFRTNPTSTPGTTLPPYPSTTPVPLTQGWKKWAFVSAPWEPSGVLMIIILIINIVLNIVIATSDAGDGGDDEDGETSFVTDQPTCFPVAQSPEV